MTSTNDTWQVATLIESEMVASDVKSLKFSIAKQSPHIAGQHYSIKLTAPDGYIAERDYSLANPPEENTYLEFGVQLIRDGEVSPYLFDLKSKMQIKVRGPIGRHFIWEAKQNNNPLLLIGGGSGIVPLRAMILHHLKNYKPRTVILLLSFKSIERVLYQFELEKLSEQYPDFKIVYTFTQKAPDKFTGYQRRVDQQMIADVFAEFKDQDPDIFVCGPTPFVEVSANALVAVGFNPQKIKTERFG